MYLAGDIGGTKTILAIVPPDGDPRSPVAQITFPSADYPSLETMVRDFLGRVHHPVEKASFAVAGPVLNGKAEITNLPWVLEETRLQDELGLQAVRLMNDLEAVGYALQVLNPEEMQTLQEGRPVPGGAIAVIAPGTGLGEAYLTWDGKQYRAHPSEGGHTDFAPLTPLQFGLLRYLQERIGHVSYERICSGMGIPNIYAYLKESGYADEPPWLAEQLAVARDPTPVIVEAALSQERTSDLCRAVLHTFVSVLGAEAGNMALKILATGGVYLAGGIPPRILPVLAEGTFLENFVHKGRFADLLAQIPVRVVLNPKTGILGAACHVLSNYHD